MTVKELRTQLENFDDNMKVYTGVEGQVEILTNICLANIEDSWVIASPGDENFNENNAICLVE